MRHTKIQHYCESVIEAGWLAALIVAPLFFNTYSSRVFEPDKASLIRSISLVMLLAYLVKILDGGRIWLPAGGGGPPAGDQAIAAGERSQSTFEWKLGSLWKQPLLLPFVLLVISYAISTLLSISPSVSWWGSYHRLQGAYTFASYLIIALLTAAHLRQSSQLRRLQHTVVITSLPIAVYAVFQHFGKDPLPWARDVSGRVTASAGNPIFLAAHLIMAFFLTLERTVSCFAFLLTGGSRPGGDTAADAAPDTAPEGERVAPTPDYSLAGILAGGCYLFVLVIQLLAIFWSQSRGPWLGLASGMYIFVLLLLSGMRPRNYRLLTAAWAGLGLVGLALLIVLNTTAIGRSFRHVPNWGRLTTMLDSATGTGRVRVLLWEGTAKLISPHEPLTYPDGRDDPINPIRPLIGYGPETLWMAFNRFYPPELAQWESRNASPDRAHNETWDSLAMTGVLGFLANSLLFLSIFFWAMRWLGLIRSRRDVILFFSMLAGGGILLSALFQMRGVSIGFIGVNWPTGLILGLIAYVTLAVFMQQASSTATAHRPRQLLLVASLSAIIAHYVEIHLGIAIVATRIYFWTIVALLLGLGMNWLFPETFAPNQFSASQAAPPSEENRRARNRRSATRGRAARGRREARSSTGGWDIHLPALILPDLLVMMTLVFLFAINIIGMSNAGSVLFAGLGTALQDRTGAPLTDILWLVLFAWLIATVLGTATAFLRHHGLGLRKIANSDAEVGRRRNEETPHSSSSVTARPSALSVVLYGLILFAGWLLYGLIHAARLLPGARTGTVAEQLDLIAGHYSLYTWVVVLWCLLAGLFLSWRKMMVTQQAWFGRGLATAGAGVLMSAAVFYIIANINIAQVRADVFYRQGQNFDSAGAWVESSDLYSRALAVRPTEDYYMLHLGRSLLERAAYAPVEGSLSFPSHPTLQHVLDLNADEIALLGRDALLSASEAVLSRAQEANPLNTDHTSNLARLYSRWAILTDDPQAGLPALEKSLHHYDVALSLSPNAAHLWNERGQIMVSMGREEEAEASFLHSLSLDDRFENTYAFLIELYTRTDESEKLTQLFDSGLEKFPHSLVLLTHKGAAQSRAGDLEGALASISLAFEKHPTDLNAVRNLVVLSRLLDRPEEAARWAERAIALIESGHDEIDKIVATYSVIADFNVENGRLLQAADILHRLVELAPHDYRFPFQLAHVHSELGNNQQARQFGESALALAPDNEKPGVQAFVDSLE